MQQIVPTVSNGLDAVNFRQMHESSSLHLEKQHSHSPQASPRPPSAAPSAVYGQHLPIRGVAGSAVPGTPGLRGDDGMDPPSEEVDLFTGFSSITLHYDGEN